MTRRFRPRANPGPRLPRRSSSESTALISIITGTMRYGDHSFKTDATPGKCAPDTRMKG